MATGANVAATSLIAALTAVLLGCGSEAETSAKRDRAYPAAKVQTSTEPFGQCSTRLDVKGGDALRQALWSSRSDAEPVCLFMAASAWADHDRTKASDLFALAMVRLRYDVVRCSAPISQSAASAMTAVRMATGDRLLDLGILVGPKEVGAAARNPESYRYPDNHLKSLCDGNVRPESEWSGLQAVMKQENAKAEEAPEAEQRTAHKRGALKSARVQNVNVTAGELLQRLDLTSFRNSTGPNRGGGRKYPSDWGFTELRTSAEWASLERPNDWDLTLRIIRRTPNGVIVCFSDDSQTATYSAVSTLHLLNDGDAGYTASDLPNPDPTCLPRPGQG